MATVGERSPYVANIDLSLAVIHNDHKDYAGAIRLLEDALATDEALIGKERIETADVLFSSKPTRVATHTWSVNTASACTPVMGIRRR